MTPIAPRVPDSGTPSSTSETSTPITSDTAASETSSPQTGSPWVLEGRLSAGASVNGGINGSLIAINPVGTLGDFSYFELAGSLLHDLTDGDVRLRAGGQLSVSVLTGNENTGGSTLYNATIGPRAELDWRRVYGTGIFAGPSRLNVDFGIGYGGGATVAETYSLHDQSGLALSLGAALNLLNVTVGDIEFGLDAFVRTTAILGNAFNSPFDTVGGSITIRGAAEHPIQEVNQCTESNYQERVAFLVEENQGLRESYEANRSFLAALQGILEAQGVDRASLVQSLRVGYGEYLAHRETDPVADAAERERLAAERFPDDFDPFHLPDVAEVTVPEPLPEDCDDLFALVNHLEDERTDLSHQNGVAEGTVNGILIRMGITPSAAPHLSRAITRLQELHFITNRPFGDSHDRGYSANGDIVPLDQATTAYLGANAADAHGMRESRPLAELEDLYRGIFPRTRDHNDGSWYSPSLRALGQIAESLRDPDMAEATFYIVGNTDSRGDEAHNQGLSERRARAIRDALIMMGVPPERLVAIGRGERNLIYYFDQNTGRETEHRLSQEEIRELRRDGITGSSLTDEVTGRLTTNRRVEMYVCFPSSGPEGAADQVCIALASEPAAAGPAPAVPATSSEGAAAPVQEVQSPVQSQATAPAAHRRHPPQEASSPPPPPPAEHPAAPVEGDE